MTALFSRAIGPHERGWATEHGEDDVTAFYRVVLSATRGYQAVAIVDPNTGRAVVFVLWNWRDEGAVYVGRCTTLGDPEFGNFAARPGRNVPRRALEAEHERCVLAYAAWLAEPARWTLRKRIRRRLRGKLLACHCIGRGLACHAEVIAVWANTCVPCDVLRPSAS